jgi:hypothetical protein
MMPPALLHPHSRFGLFDPDYPERIIRCGELRVQGRAVAWVETGAFAPARISPKALVTAGETESTEERWLLRLAVGSALG